MVSRRASSALVCVMVGLGCIGSVVRAHPGSGPGAAASPAAARAPEPRTAAAPPARPAAAPIHVASIQAASAAQAAAADDDTDLPTGSIAPGSAVHVPNPAAYKGAPKMGDPVTVEGAEAINYLAGNTLRREGPGEPLHFTYFASRGLMGEGDERGFTARRWDRELPKLCEAGPGSVPPGATPCRSVTILLDGIYEFPGARLGTVTLGAAGGLPAATAVLVKGNAMHFPEHIPFLDSAVDVAAAGGEVPRGDPVEALAGHPVAAVGARGRQISYYARDNRRFELQQVQAGDGKAVQVTVGHWHAAKGGLCQARTAGGAQTCFKAEAAAGGVRLVPAGKGGGGGGKADEAAQTLTVLPETGAREVAQD